MLGVRLFNTFERSTWHLSEKRASDHLGHCLLTMAYMAGWCEANFNVPMIAIEVACNATNTEDEKRPYCDFVIAHPNHVENFVDHYFEHGLQPPTKTALNVLAKTRSLRNTERPGMGYWLQKIISRTSPTPSRKNDSTSPTPSRKNDS